MSNSAAEFVQLLRESFRDGTFIHLVLSRPVQDPERSAGESDLSPTKISVRAVELKAGPQLQFAEQTGSQERHRNLDYESGCVEVESLFAVTFRHGHLFTTTVDVMAKAKSAKGAASANNNGYFNTFVSNFFYLFCIRSNSIVVNTELFAPH